MAAPRLLMRKLRELLRLKYEAGLSHRAIARACTLGLGTVTAYLQRATAAGLSWPLPADLDDGTLEARLFRLPLAVSADARPQPVWADLHQERKRPGVTLQLLWMEYRATQPTGYAYSQFCARYRTWLRTLTPTMRQVHRAGEKVFVDFAGKRPHLVDPATGVVRPVELFVASLGASGYLYAEATLTQDLASWIGAHVRMVDAYGGSPAIWIPDNLKSGVTTAHRYEPEVNRTYADLAQHYGAVVIPARPRHPRDKARVEVSVLLAERWIVAVLRDRTFFTLLELNPAIATEVARLNDRVMKGLGVSRRTLFADLDQPALRPLPPTRYELAEWRLCRVNIDYHIAVDQRVYSVPHALLHAQVDARLTATVVEVFFKGRRVAAHPRLPGRGHASTDPAHMPAAHRAHAEWTPSRLIAWAERTGPATGRLVAGILERRRHPEQGYRACLGLLRLGRRHGDARLDAACARAERLEAYSYQVVQNILARGQDHLPLDDTPDADRAPILHDNLRGAPYYTRKEPVC
jgi:transposase